MLSSGRPERVCRQLSEAARRTRRQSVLMEQLPVGVVQHRSVQCHNYQHTVRPRTLAQAAFCTSSSARVYTVLTGLWHRFDLDLAPADCAVF